MEHLASFVPSRFLDSSELAKKLGKGRDFLEERIGTDTLPLQLSESPVVDLSQGAFERLMERTALDPSELEVLAVVTQNPDSGGLPHNAAMLHHRLNLSKRVETFDLGLGCSGWVHGVAILSGYMHSRGLRKGVLITADPYSKLLSEDHSSTRLLFGDAGTATLLSDRPRWVSRRTRTHTDSSNWKKIQKLANSLEMNGRAVYEFASRVVPQEIRAVVSEAGLSVSDIDTFVIHQGSKAVVDAVRKAFPGQADRFPTRLLGVGNTVSSSVPMTLEQSWLVEQRPLGRFVASGFGVGLAVASTVFESS